MYRSPTKTPSTMRLFGASLLALISPLATLAPLGSAAAFGRDGATDQRGLWRPVELAESSATGGNAFRIRVSELQVDPVQSGVPSLIVNTPDDHDDGECTDGDCTLREAIIAANSDLDTSTITFNIPGAGPHVIQLTAPLDDLETDMIIQGPTDESVEVRGESEDDPYSIFTILLAEVSISNLTISNGAEFGFFGGGGILNFGFLTVNNSIFTDNLAEFGGAIDNEGFLTINNSTFTDNEAGVGGAVFNVGVLNIENSTFTRNHAFEDGGAIDSDDGNLTIVNSTISGNSADGDGGGLFQCGGCGSPTGFLTNVTITGNRADADGNGLGVGGGLINISSGVVTLLNTIVAGNFNGESPDPTPDDIDGPMDPASSYNLIGIGGSGGLIDRSIDPTHGNQVGVANPRLGPLQDNGGPTFTHGLLAGSPALDAGNNGFVSDTDPPFTAFNDQRGPGFLRIRDAADADTTQTVDIGAFEADPSVEDISDKSTNEDVALPTFTFNVGDSGTPFTNIAATSNNQTLVPDGNIVVGSNTASTRTLSITPATNEFGTATITVTVIRGTQSMSDTFILTVNAVNDPPSFTKGPDDSVAEDSGARSVTPWATNISPGPANESGQTLTFLVQTNTNPGLFAAGPAISPTGTLTYTPAANANGTATITIVLMDNGGGTNTSPAQTFVITVREVNDSPAAVGETIPNVAEDSGQLTIPFATLTANDSKGPANESGQTLIVKTASNAVGGTVSIVGGNLVFTPTADYNGPASFQYTVEDNGTTSGAADPKTSGPATVSFTITEVNDAPTAVSETITNSAEDSGLRTILASTLTTNDSKGPANENGQTLIIKTVSNAVGGTVGIVGGNVVFTPTADYAGPASFQYTVEDNGTTNGAADPKTSGPATVSFTITEVNDPPDAVNDALSSVAEDSGLRTIPITSLLSNDSKGPASESGQTLTLTGVSNPIGGTVSSDATNVYFTPAANFNGAASFEYMVTDNGTSNGAPDPKSDTATVSFTVTEVNDAPTAGNDPLGTVAEDSGQRTIQFSTLLSNDSKGPANESGQTLIVKTVSNPVGGTVSIVAGTVRFTPTANYFGQATFQYTIEDNGTTNGLPDPKTATAIAHFNITPVADTPSVTNATTNANTPTTSGLVISRNPADGAEVTHFKITGITGGLLFKNDGITPINNGDFITFAEGNAGLKFTPGTTNGSFTVQASLSASDAGLGGATATATITVNPIGGVIRFSAANYSVAEGAGFRVITVERTGDIAQPVTVDYASSDHSNPADFIPCTAPGAGFASSRCDFTTALGRLWFAAGETSKTFNVLISQDNYVEGPETLSLTLTNPTGGAVFGVPQTAILSIADDVSEGATNPIDTSSEFVRAQYHDILHREPDAAGLAFWTDNIEKCNDPARRPAGQTAAQCIDKQRESTAIAFFMSPEFQMTGGFVYRLYKGSLTGAPNYDGGSPGSSPGRFPTFVEFTFDLSQVSEGIVVSNQISGAVVEANRNRLAAEFVQRPEFLAKYGGLNNTLYVQELFNTTGITATAAQKQALVDGLGNSTETRASVLRKVVDGTVVISEGNVQFTTAYGQALYNQEYRRVFVYMEYVGYLRRNPDAAGFNFWLGKLNFFNGDPFQAEMVRSFILSPEYRSRFGTP